MERPYSPPGAELYESGTIDSIIPDVPKVGISSDDGPNKSNIEEVLGILNENAVRATFFWIVDYAAKFKSQEPVVFGRFMNQIKDDGHEVGLHAPYDYRPSLRTRLIGQFTEEEIAKALEELKSLTDMNIEYYRPHILFQPITVLYARRLGLKTPIPDPRHYADADAPVERQIEKFSGGKHGSILVFHDGLSMFRQVTRILEVMPRVIVNLRERGLEPTNISGLPRGSYRSL